MKLEFSRRGHFPQFVGICVVAFAVLAYQVLLTRIFSVMLYYHFAFVGISLAMLGLTVGAQKVYANAKRFAPQNLEREWAKAALCFAASIVVLTISFLYIPPLVPNSAVITCLIVLFVIPFVYSGICVALILTKSEASIGKLYATDLIGASAGCMGIVGVLFYLDPITVIFGLAGLIALSAWFMAAKIPRLANISKLFAFLWLFFFAMHGGLYLSNAPHMDVVWAKGHVLRNVLFERWNAFSLVRVSAGETRIPFGWGFGHKQTEEGPDQMGLIIDAQAGTAITNFDGKNLAPYSYLSNDVINMGYQIRPIGDVAVIGVGGGRDILSALYFKAKHISGIELNPAIFEALTDHFADFSGHLDRRPEVSLVNAEARSWLNHTDKTFDMIQISLIDTWAATAAGGLSLSENKLYTVDAWKDFLNRLNPKGMLSVSRWFDAKAYKFEFYRLLSLAAETLQERGVSADEIKRHVLVFSTEQHETVFGLDAGVATLVISPTAFTDGEISHAVKFAEQQGFHALMTPETAWDDISRTILSGTADQAFYARMSRDMSPTTDDRPFFFHTTRLRSLMLNGGKTENSAAGENNLTIYIVFGLLLATFLCTLYFTVMPYMDRKKQPGEGQTLLRHLAYFGGIGLGFMLIEISQMQRLMIFLGHPIYGLTVVLFTLLLFGGIGSAVIGALGKKNRGSWMPLIPVVLCLVLTLVGFLTPPLTAQMKGSDTTVRILLSILLLAPAGFFMGMMFPLGMEASMRYREMQSWFWGVNGATSVLGSVLGVVVSMESGISSAFWTGVGFYALCALLMLAQTKGAGSEKTPGRLKRS